MEKVISIGKQNFASLRENHYFFVDKSHFIKDWWENGDEITLITRPRRFGKTLNMSMLDCFFSNKYAARGDLFEGLGRESRSAFGSKNSDQTADCESV